MSRAKSNDKLRRDKLEGRHWSCKKGMSKTSNRNNTHHTKSANADQVRNLDNGNESFREGLDKNGEGFNNDKEAKQ